MSDRLSNMEIQDVLSSIRRLVSEDRSPLIANVTKKAELPPAAKEPKDKLVLTPAHRVQEDSDAEVQDDAPEPADSASLEETIAELEAAVANTGGEFEPDGSEVEKPDPAEADPDLERAFEDSFAVDVAAEEEQESALSQPVTSGQMDEGDSGDEAEAETASDPAEPEVAKTAAELASEDSGPTPEAGEAAPAAVNMPSREQLNALIAAETTTAAGAFAARRLNLSATDLVQDGGAPWGRTDAPQREDSTVHEDEGARDEPARPASTTIDIEAEADAQLLREIVADIVRQELQGPLGERITRSVRMLVRREINRALESRDFE